MTESCHAAVTVDAHRVTLASGQKTKLSSAGLLQRCDVPSPPPRPHTCPRCHWTRPRSDLRERWKARGWNREVLTIPGVMQRGLFTSQAARILRMNPAAASNLRHVVQPENATKDCGVRIGTFSTVPSENPVRRPAHE